MEQAKPIREAMCEVRTALKQLYVAVSASAAGGLEHVAHDAAMGILERTYRTTIEDIEKRHADDLPLGN